MAFKSKKGYLCRFLPKTLMSHNVFLLLLLFCMPLFCGFFLTNDAGAVDLNISSPTAVVNFYTNQQITATVNLPWTANPGTSTFYLNNVIFDNTDIRDKKVTNISGRAVTVLNSKTLTDIYICGLKSGTLQDEQVTQCLGSVTISYKDGSQTVSRDLPVYIIPDTTNVSSPSDVIYFDYSFSADPALEVSFIQYIFYAKSGYDVYSRNTPNNGNDLLVLVEARGSLSYYEVGDTSTDITPIISQGNIMIDQNNQIISELQNQSDKENNSIENIENQSPDDYSDTENQATTNIIGVISSFFGQFTNFTPTNCEVTLPFPDFFGGSMTQNICSGKEQAGEIISIVGSLIMVGFYIPLAFALLKMIYSEIRSFTNG